MLACCSGALDIAGAFKLGAPEVAGGILTAEIDNLPAATVAGAFKLGAPEVAGGILTAEIDNLPAATVAGAFKLGAPEVAGGILTALINNLPPATVAGPIQTWRSNLPGAAPVPAFSRPGAIVPESRSAWKEAASEIRAECVRRPGIPVPKGKAPEGGKPYKVQDGDTWSNLARQQGMDAWTLIRFNFPNLPEDVRAASPEVNWYMREHVGCNVVTGDGRNYRFSSSAHPGLIYLPGSPTVPSPAVPKGVVEVQHWRFWTAMPYLHQAMTLDAQSQDAAEIKELADVQPGMAIERWVRLVRPNGRWDHDTPLRRMLALDLDLHFPVDGDKEHEYFYGIWIEIHHGYVAASTGLRLSLLETGNPIDNECIRIGASLWAQHGLNVTPRHVYTALLARRDALLAMQESPEYLQSVGGSGHRHIQNISNGE